MVYVATVHWKDDRWIALQREFMTRWINEPFKVFGYLNGISQEFYRFFDHVRDQDDPSHAEKLNILAQEITRDSKNASDILIFLDGDAFPIAPLDHWIEERLSAYPLIAVQRTENLGDIQPHPCFCVTTVGFWNSIQGDWNAGYTWRLENGIQQTDVGGNLLRILEEKSIPWLKMHRTNTMNMDDLMFGVYENVVYHHGAGFRPQKGGRISMEKAGRRQLFKRLDVRILEKWIPKQKLMQFRFSIFHPYGRMRRRIYKRLTKVSDSIYAQLKKDPEYVHTFIKPLPQKI